MCLFHKWGKWEILKEGELRKTETKTRIGRVIVQRRVCTKCGKTQESAQTTMYVPDYYI